MNARDSLKNALKRGDFSRAKEKIDDNLLLLHANVKELQEYLFKIGSKKDNQALVDKSDALIIKTGENFAETFVLIKDMMDYKYNKIDKLANLKKAKYFDSETAKYKQKFEEICEKIEKQSKTLINTVRNSITKKNKESQEWNVNNPGQEFKFATALEYQEIEIRDRQINLIAKVNNQINEMSKQTVSKVVEQGETLISIEDEIDKTTTNLKSAVNEIKDADYYNKQAGSNTNKMFYIVGIIVAILVFISLILPRN